MFGRRKILSVMVRVRDGVEEGDESAECSQALIRERGKLLYFLKDNVLTFYDYTCSVFKVILRNCLTNSVTSNGIGFE